MSQRPEAPRHIPKQSRGDGALVPFISSRLFFLAALAVGIIVLVGACAIFAPYTFQQAIQAAQSAGLKTYTIVLGVTGNPTLKVSVYEADVTAQSTVTRDMGVLGLLYGENA